MNKFRIGDKVRIVSDNLCSNYRKGDVLKITEKHYGGGYIGNGYEKALGLCYFGDSDVELAFHWVVDKKSGGIICPFCNGEALCVGNSETQIETPFCPWCGEKISCEDEEKGE